MQRRLLSTISKQKEVMGIRHEFIVIVVLLNLTLLIMAAFNEVPDSQKVTVGSMAVFRCRHSTADIISWKVNGTFINRNPRSNITSHVIPEGDNPVNTLTIVASLEYNGTTIVCVAVFLNGTPAESSEPPAVLRVQGGFIVVPESQSVFVGDTATFRCRHSVTNHIGWMVDGMEINTANQLPGIVPETMLESGYMVYTLNISGHRDYNMSEVVASARLSDGSSEVSHPTAILHIVETNFVTVPTSLNITSDFGREAVFRCVYPNPVTVGWTINGTDLSNLADFRSNNNGNNGSLTIVALPQYSSTEIRCVAFFLDNRPNEKSPPAVLHIQGNLDSVKDLTQVNSSITWEAPFSLDLTNIDPDIVYCVDVYNITCGRRDLVSGDCYVTDTNYAALSDGYLYEYIVTPRSNVERAVNGTASHLRDELPTFSMTSSRLSFARSVSLRNYQVELTYSPVLPIPSSYALSLEALDGMDNLDYVETTATLEQPNSLSLDVSDLEFGRVWVSTVLTFGCEENSILDGEILSTHDLRDIFTDSPSAGNVRVTARFIVGSTATGVLVIVSGDHGVRYHNATRDSSVLLEVTITGIAGGEYTVSVFVVEETKLPFERAAMLPKLLSVEGSNVQRPSPTIEYSLESTSSGVCVTCDFLDRDTSDCVAIVHRKSDLMNILSQKFTRSGDIASGCIEGVNLKDYQVGVVGGRLLESGPARSVDSTAVIVIAVVTSVVVVLAVIVSMVSVIATVSYRKHHSHFELGDEERMHRPNHYAPAPPTENPRNPLVVPAVQRSEGDETYATVIDLNSSPPSMHHPTPANAAIQASAASDSTEMVTLYSTIADKPQPESVSPADDGRIVYSEVVKTKGVNDQLYAVVKVKEGVTVSKPDDLTKVIYSKISPCGIRRSSPALQTDNLPTTPVPQPTPFTADSVFSVLLPVASKWLDIGEAFPLSEKRLDDIDTTEGDEECLRQMIEVYMMRVDLYHTWDEIVNVLKKIEEGNLADKIFSVHVAPYVMTLPNQPQVPERHTYEYASRSSPSLGKVCTDEGTADAALDLEQQDPINEDNLVPSTHSVTVETGQSTPANSEDDYVCNVHLPTSKDESSRGDAAVLEMPSDSEESTKKNAGPGSRVDTDGDSKLTGT